MENLKDERGASVRAWLLRGGGGLLMLLGVVHLAATPHIATMIRNGATVSGARWLTAPMLLNHVLVGVLLIPVGFLAIHAAGPFGSGERWAVVVARTISLTTAVLPAALLVFVERRQLLDAPLFLAGVVIAVIAALVLLAAAFWRR
jgi:hypothetical protein